MFNSEVELEHAYVKDGHGAVELEQMYFEQNLDIWDMTIHLLNMVF